MQQTIFDDCRVFLDKLKDNCIDALATDSPYGLGFMNKSWDKEIPGPEYWTKVLRVLKPGAYGVVFGGSKGFHRLTCSIEDSGFEIRDHLAWIYTSAMPKGGGLAAKIDKHLGIITHRGKAFNVAGELIQDMKGNKPGKASMHLGISEEAKKYDDYGLCLKTAFEPIILIRKPISEKTVAANVLKYGVGGLNIGACRIGNRPVKINRFIGGARVFGGARGCEYETVIINGLWPANVIFGQLINKPDFPIDNYFFCSKASVKEKEKGLEDLEYKFIDDGRKKSIDNPYQRGKTPRKNNHPTVKPIDICRWLSRLICPPGGVLIDPFMGSGSFGCAAALEGFNWIGIDNDKESVDIAEKRIAYWQQQINKV